MQAISSLLFDCCVSRLNILVPVYLLKQEGQADQLEDDGQIWHNKLKRLNLKQQLEIECPTPASLSIAVFVRSTPVTRTLSLLTNNATHLSFLTDYISKMHKME